MSGLETVNGCIGEPVSWLRLEQAALGARDAAVDAHVAACTTCRRCLDDIRADVVALPALPALAAPAPRRRPAWLRWGVPAFGAALAAAAIAVIVLRPPPPPPDNERVARIKGVGEVVVGVVRDRDGAISEDATTFRAGDRWKVVVTCPPAAAAWLDVAVVEVSEVGDVAARAPDYPVTAARVACGNRVVVPGAFTLTGARANRVCAVAAAGPPPTRGALPADAACITIRPERE